MNNGEATPLPLVLPTSHQAEIRNFAYFKVLEEWGRGEWEAFDWIMYKESNWNYKAKNPNSSATGIPQALVITHKLGDEYLNDPEYQVVWAIEYISNTYGTPTKAKQHHLKNNWY